jgi:hypothetical protein
MVSTHKSGSSLVASWLGACGLALSDGRLMGPGPGNPLGHFEDLDFVDLHVGAIERQHPKADGWRVTTGTMTFSADERERVVALAAIRSKRYRVWGWKDPRTCLFLNEYVDVLPDLRVLSIRRPTEDVVDSLLRRSQSVPEGHGSRLSAADAAAVTRHHLGLIADFVDRHPDLCTQVDLAELLDDDYEVFRRVSAALGDQLSYVPVSHVLRDDQLHR